MTSFVEQDTFLEFVEKLVILELINGDRFLQTHFLKNKSFPFDHTNFLGNEAAMLSVFTFWSHYYAKYQAELEHHGVVSEQNVAKWQEEMQYF